MSKRVLGLDLGSNSLGWALLEEQNGKVNRFIDIGSRIFSKAVEEKTPTPKNVKRRDMRLGRRVLQRRARRKQRMLHYLVSLNLLPAELQGHTQPEVLLNKIGDPYQLRTKALDEQLTSFELGRVLLHFVARRGFLSSKKQVAGDLVDDPDTVAYLEELDKKPAKDKKEGEFKRDINDVRDAIQKSGCRTLGEYLHNKNKDECKRNRNHEGGHLRTDRQMCQDELTEIWQQQKQYFDNLPDDFMTDHKGIKQIIFYQRPLKLKKDRIGKCSLEPKNNRAATARLEVQRFRYLQKNNDLKYFDRYADKEVSLSPDDRKKLNDYFEHHEKINITALRKLFGFDSKATFNLEMKDIKGNITACEIRSVLKDNWDNYSSKQQDSLVEDLLSIKKKSALKNRLIKHWGFDPSQAVKLCLLEFEPGHSSHSLKAINKLLPHMKQGLMYSEARIKAGYGYEVKDIEIQDKLGTPPETANPIVNKGLHELKRVINAIIKHYGKLDIIRIEMARDLEMNTKRYKENEARQAKNRKENDKAIEAYRELNPGKYPSHNDKIKYRLWQEQNYFCAYSRKSIPLNAVFTANVEIDHILPYKKSLDDSYMNKVVCFTAENRNKGDRTPKDTWGNNEEKWNQITQAISGWKGLDTKVKRFFQTEADLQQRDFISTQLNDTRYISKLAIEYVKQLGCDVSVTKGHVVSQIRHQWGLNDLIGETDKKERTDHRHHAIDAAVIAATSRSLYKSAVAQIQHNKLNIAPPYRNFRDELDEYLKHVIVSHDTQRKLSGALHQEIGAGFIEGKGTVYRKTLTSYFDKCKTQKETDKKLSSIIDPTVKKLLKNHLEKFQYNADTAFSDNNIVLHKDGKTPIKRVRLFQSTQITKKDTLEKEKFGVRNKKGEIFKWMPYGNMHHVEIIKHKKTGRHKGECITMMEAHRRAMTGTKSAQKHSIEREQIIQKNHGDDWEFVMALHINDLVSVDKGNNERGFYRVQKLGGGYDLTLRLHTETSTKREKWLIENKKMLENSFGAFISDLDLKLHRINAIGIISHD